MLSTDGRRLVEVFAEGEFADYAAVVCVSRALTDTQKAYPFGARGYLYKLPPGRRCKRHCRRYGSGTSTWQ